MFVRVGGATSSRRLSVPGNSTGIELRKQIKNEFKDQLRGVKLKDIVFVQSTKTKVPLSNDFYDTYKNPEAPLQITVAGFIPNPISSDSNPNLFNAKDDFEMLANNLKVSNRLYIRRCYSEIRDDILKYIQKRQVQRVNVPGLSCDIFLTGTPGIGKTAFLLFLIHHLRGKYPVMFGSKLRPKEFHYWDKDGTHSVIEEVGAYLNDGQIIFIMDSCNIASTAGPCLICSSPRDSIDGQFRKTAARFFMPVWSWDEIFNCHATIYSPLVTEKLLKARFFVLGGVPRYLFDDLNTLAVKLIETAFSNTTWEVLNKVAGSNGSSDNHEISHRLGHRINISGLNGEYSDYEPRFASNFVAVMAVQNYSRARRESIIQVLDETSNLGYTGALRGNVFEPVAHQCIILGGNIIGKELLANGTSKPFELKLCKRTVQTVSGNYSDIPNHALYTTDETKYFKPLSRIFECLDSWIVINGETWGLQFTVGKSHRISSAIHWYYQYLKLKHYVTVVYNQAKYDSFQYSTITKSKKNPFNDFPEPLVFMIRQYVIKLDLDGEILNGLVRTEGYDTFIPDVDDRIKMELGLSEGQ